MAEDREHVTVREFDKFSENLGRQITDGFRGVNDRLDRVNGRLDKNESAVHALTPRVTAVEIKAANLNREVFREDRTPSQLVSRQDDEKPITRRDLSVAIGVAVVVVGVMIWLFEKLSHVGIAVQR